MVISQFSNLHKPQMLRSQYFSRTLEEKYLRSKYLSLYRGWELDFHHMSLTSCTIFLRF